MSRLARTVELANGRKMPIIGVGTWQVRDPQVLYDTIDAAFSVGYRFIDTAVVYENEQHIGVILQKLQAKHNLKRDDIFITSKLPPRYQGRAIECVHESLKRLQTTYIDLYLIHWPGTGGLDGQDKKNAENRAKSFEQLQQLVDEGLLRSVGVSNYMINHLDELMATKPRHPPVVNQCEYHPFLANTELLEHCRKLGIHLQAYSSFGSHEAGTDLLGNVVVSKLAAKHACSTAQILLAWAMAQNVSVLPRSSKVAHVMDNFNAIDVQLSQDDIDQLTALNQNKHYCWNPNKIL